MKGLSQKLVISLDSTANLAALCQFKCAIRPLLAAPLVYLLGVVIVKRTIIGRFEEGSRAPTATGKGLCVAHCVCVCVSPG